MELILLKCIHGLHSANLRYLQAIGNAWKVLGGGRTHPWTSYAAVFMGHHKPHLLAQLYAHKGLPFIIFLIYPLFNSPSVSRSLTLSLQSPTGKWSRFPTLSKGFHLSVSGSLNEFVIVSLFQKHIIKAVHLLISYKDINPFANL